ncbi:unnamed protein product [Rotaria sordida]|uniref:Acetyl-coenzyme A transporter 1 n=1 Tax=Rotaria sordida TaxID=392033 RepID=A0A814GBL3_9BILA|nr:unnamed protein product [Rotaria sordida]CAF1000407.1 unnamed protein product [Rotaria sordida]
MEFRYRLKKKPTLDKDINQTQPFIKKKSAINTDSLSSSLESGKEIINNNSSSSLIMPPISKRSDWRKDKSNISLLLFLYLLQGIPLGMAASIPLIIQTYGTSWSQQATFSFAFWPFSLKLLWAPIVDALYIKRYGRRKTWLIPVQYLIGLVMIILSYHISDILFTTQTSTNNQSHIYFLTSIFFGLSFLAATQDICVDGWALSMLSRENVGWASTCNSVGQTAGYFLGNVVFLAFESKDFTNRYIRQPLNMELQSNGLITLPGFLLFWGIIFIISTTLVALIKHEIDENYDSHEPHFGLTETYKVLLKIFRLSSVRSIALILLTAKIGFAATDAMTGLELIERGVARDSLALLAIPLVPLQIILPFVISKYTTGTRPLNIYIKSYPFRLILGVIMAIFVYYTPIFQNYNKTFPWYYYTLAIIIYVSDPKIGGTYMTLLNTLSNLGSNWISTTVLYAADYLTWKTCSLGGSQCETTIEEKNCHMLGGVCRLSIDPYYIEVTICTIAGIIWLLWKYQTIVRLQYLPISAWQVRSNRRKSQLLEEGDESSLVTSA